MLENATNVEESFAGAVGMDNETLYIAEFDGGYALATLTSKNDIELIYLKDGKNSSIAIDELHRIMI